MTKTAGLIATGVVLILGGCAAVVGTSTAAPPAPTTISLPVTGLIPPISTVAPTTGLIPPITTTVAAR